MRISDWSSDVCSSDLVPDEIEAEQLHQRHVERRDDDQHGGVVEEGSHDQVAELHEDEDLPGCQAQAVDEEALDGIHRAEPEIGRAHVRTPVTNANIVCRLLLEKNTS